ncbi:MULTISPECIES: serine protease [Cyanophyceae]|uniref:serine protease n=1 Tax=Cyanophyceae TaxID=3028117 RepID=UPI002330B1F3|nr:MULTISPECIES: serine protease [Cyanophyceae]MDB9356184.1 serine protease [Nodularia spumigena CS-587/03]MDB9341544.1 serine protease [Nodularia spumigena CS-589/07]MDB9399770.1 serine protease [Microcystis aeruginosa CS-567/02-A1]MDB9499053.1 serine protease [Nodularia spumigena CS-336/02]MDB9531233.1 serine protease [Nodularia spumigena CS-1038]
MANENNLQSCTVRLNFASSQGTGFFVAPNLILTCAHVVQLAKDNPVQVFWKAEDQNYTAKVTQLYEAPIDLALLKLDENCWTHPCVELDSTEPNTNDNCYTFGYPKSRGNDYSQGDSASFRYEGISYKQDIILYKLKQGQINSGFSGSPLLNLRTGKVCGIVHLSRDESSDLGGRAISAQVIQEKFPDIFRQNPYKFHQQKPKGINPFDYGPPVPPERFYGRKREILEIKNRIGASSPQCINLVGLRRNGKSSLMQYIKKRITEFCSPEQKPLVVDLDLSSRNFNTPEGIIEGLRRGIYKLTGNYPWSREDNEDGFAVEDGLQDLVDEGYRLIILLDDFEAIASKKERLELFQDWGEDWRSKASAGLLTMVIASKRPLNEVYETLSLGSPFANIFSTTILGALEEEAWQSIIHKGFTPNSGLWEWVDELAGGLPYYVQMTGAMLWQEENNQEKAKKEFTFQAQPRFQELWNDLTEVERLALRYQLGGGNLPSPDQAIVDMLQRHGLIRKDGGLFSSVFAEFVKGQK